MTIPATAKIISPRNNWEDYRLKAGKHYTIKVNKGVGRYIHGGDPEPIYIDTELRQDVIDNFDIIE